MYELDLIEQMGARNFAEADIMRRIKDIWAYRHVITPTHFGMIKNKFNRDAIRALVKDLRAYRKWLDSIPSEDIPGTPEKIAAVVYEYPQTSKTFDKSHWNKYLEEIDNE